MDSPDLESCKRRHSLRLSRSATISGTPLPLCLSEEFTISFKETSQYDVGLICTETEIKLASSPSPLHIFSEFNDRHEGACSALQFASLQLSYNSRIEEVRRRAR